MAAVLESLVGSVNSWGVSAAATAAAIGLVTDNKRGNRILLPATGLLPSYLPLLFFTPIFPSLF